MSSKKKKKKLEHKDVTTTKIYPKKNTNPATYQQ